MAEKIKSENESETKAISTKPTERYSKARILSSKAYKKDKDLLKVLLEDDKSYTKQEIKKLIDGYMKKGVE